MLFAETIAADLIDFDQFTFPAKCSKVEEKGGGGGGGVVDRDEIKFQPRSAARPI